MPEREVHIERLNIRLPGYLKDKGQDIGQDVANKLSTKLPGDFKAKHSGSHNLYVKLSNDTTPGQIPGLITEAIIKVLV